MPDAPGLAWGPYGPLAWSGSQLIQLRGDSSDTAWLFDLKAAPEVEVVATAGGDDSTNDVKPDETVEGEIVVQGNARQRIIMQGNRRFIVRANGIQQFAVQPNPNLVNTRLGGEVIIEVRPVGETAIVTTSTGRMVAIDLTDGHIR